MILPQALYDVVWEGVKAKISNVQYSRVIMSLSELLEGDFFNKYIKIGILDFVHDPVDLWHIIKCIKIIILLISTSLFRQYLDAL